MRVLIIAFFILASPKLYAATVRGHVLVHEDKSESPGKPAADAVVFLETVPKGDGFNRAKEKLDPHPTMASKDKAFVPQVLPVLEGTTVDFPNDDHILHNVFSLSKIKPFDLGLFNHGAKKDVNFSKSGLVKVYCNIHEAMVGYILILENPFFTKTDSSGNFTISDVPTGKYKVVAWHRYSSDTSSKDIILGGAKEVSVGGKDAAVNFELVEDSRVTKHTNKWGKDYKDKY